MPFGFFGFSIYNVSVRLWDSWQMQIFPFDMFVIALARAKPYLSSKTKFSFLEEG